MRVNTKNDYIHTQTQNQHNYVRSSILASHSDCMCTYVTLTTATTWVSPLMFVAGAIVLWQVWVGPWWLTVQLSSCQIHTQYSTLQCITTTTHVTHLLCMCSCIKIFSRYKQVTCFVHATVEDNCIPYALKLFTDETFVVFTVWS